MNLTCRTSYFILPCFLPVLFLLTSYEAIPARLAELAARLLLLVLRLTHPMPFHRVGFLRGWVTTVFLDDSLIFS